MRAPSRKPWAATRGWLTLAFCASWIGAPVAARAAEEQTRPPSHVFVHLAVGPAYMRESWRPDTAGTDPSVSFGWGPSLEVAVGKKGASGWAIAASWQLTGIFNRDETYRGQRYHLPSTAHVVGVLALRVDYRPRLRWPVHFGASAGALAVSEIDTYDGATDTRWGVAAAVHAGADPFRRGRWSIGLVARLSFYRYGSETPAPPMTVNAVLPTLLVVFTRD